MRSIISMGIHHLPAPSPAPIVAVNKAHRRARGDKMNTQVASRRAHGLPESSVQAIARTNAQRPLPRQRR